MKDIGITWNSTIIFNLRLCGEVGGAPGSKNLGGFVSYKNKVQGIGLIPKDPHHTIHWPYILE